VARLSSTSNSDDGGTTSVVGLRAPVTHDAAAARLELPPGVPSHGGFPWAFTLALLIVLIVEIVVRQVEPKRLIPYTSPRLEYQAVRSYVDAYGPGDVSFVGDSRTRAGVLITDVAKAGLPLQGLPAGNYGLSAANMPVVDTVTRYLLRQPSRPRLILYGASPHHLYSTARNVDRLANFWDVRDWWRAGGLRDWQTRREIPTVIRNYLGDAWHTFEYREYPPVTLSRLLLGEPSHCVIVGELTVAHQREPNVSIVERPVTPEWETWFFKGWSEGQPINQKNITLLRALIEECRAANVDFVMYEMPAAGILRKRIGPLYDNYIAAMQRVATETGVPFLTVEDLGLTLTDREFAEYSHVNLPGARLITRALVERALRPRLAGPTSVPVVP
jgi:hypothetical protein